MHLRLTRGIGAPYRNIDQLGKFMIIDLSHTIKMGMPVYPGSPQPKISDLGLYDEHGVYVQEFTLHGHVGTHLDAPAHLFADGNTVESMDISAFFGTAQVLDCSKFGSNEIIDSEILDQLNVTEHPDFILLYTGWDKMWPTENYFELFPVVSEDLIGTLAETKIKGIGLDTISLDSIDAHDLPNHKKILRSDKIIIENLTNLQRLMGKRFQFSCFPLKMLNGDGSPVRAVGIVD